MSFDRFAKKVFRYAGYAILILIASLLLSYIKQGLSDYILSIRGIVISFIDTSVFLGIFLLIGFLFGQSDTKKNLLGALDGKGPSWVDGLLVIPIQDEETESEKAVIEFLTGKSLKGFIFNLGFSLDKYIYILKKEKAVVVKSFVLKISILLIIASYLGMEVKDPFLMNTSSHLGFSPFLADVLMTTINFFIIALIFILGVAIGDHITKRKFTCTWKNQNIPICVGEYVVLPCKPHPLFRQFSLTYVLHLEKFKENLPRVESKIEWDILGDKIAIKNIGSYIEEIASREIEKIGYRCDFDLLLWVKFNPLHQSSNITDA